MVYLTSVMAEMTKRLVALRPTGPLFPTFKQGRPFTKNAIRCRFRRLQAKLPHQKHFVAYNYRATFATNALENGVGIAQVAELLGHADTTMVSKHYSMLSQKVQHLRDMVRKATEPTDHRAGRFTHALVSPA